MLPDLDSRCHALVRYPGRCLRSGSQETLCGGQSGYLWLHPTREFQPYQVTPQAVSRSLASLFYLFAKLRKERRSRCPKCKLDISQVTPIFPANPAVPRCLACPNAAQMLNQGNLWEAVRTRQWLHSQTMTISVILKHELILCTMRPSRLNTLWQQYCARPQAAMRAEAEPGLEMTLDRFLIL